MSGRLREEVREALGEMERLHTALDAVGGAVAYVAEEGT